jgi:hypothetical protein
VVISKGCLFLSLTTTSTQSPCTMLFQYLARYFPSYCKKYSIPLDTTEVNPEKLRRSKHFIEASVQPASGPRRTQYVTGPGWDTE